MSPCQASSRGHDRCSTEACTNAPTTALRDANLLRQQLIQAARGSDVIAAVAEYERQMLDYGFQAVKVSLRNTRQVAKPSRVRSAVSGRFCES